jgi:acyl-CoA synthetase (AMP-forming)/AMP-acid ligase II
MAHIAPQLTSYKRPSEIIVLDALPATSTGKILKHKLAESLRSAALEGDLIVNSKQASLN